MKKYLFLVIAIFAMQISFAQTTYFKFEFENKKQLNKLTRLISIDNVRGNTAWAYATASQLQEFKKQKIDFQKLEKNSSSTRALDMATTYADLSTNWDKYPTYDLYIQMMTDYATNYPDICELIDMGDSQQGRQILALKISDNVGTNELEPEFYYTSTMHGDEATGFPIMLRLIDYLLSGYSSDSEVAGLINDHEIFINPLSNPDGTYWNNYGSLSFEAANLTVSNAIREYADGKDPNRDFPDPFNGDNTPYRAETQVQMDFASDHHFVMSVNFHGGAEVFNYPWDYFGTSTKPHPDRDLFLELGANYVEEARLLNSSYLTSVTSSGVTNGADWYQIIGGRQDYMNYWHHCKEITVEISNSKLAGSETLPTFWDYNKQSILNYVNETRFGFNGTVKNIEGDPLDAKIEILAHDEDNTWVVTDPFHGGYYRPIAPGTYSVTYSSDSYISQTHEVIVSDFQTTVIKNVILGQAQILEVTGVVSDFEDQELLENATIEILNTQTPIEYSLVDGTFSIPNIYEGNYEIKASKAGYIPKIINFDLSSGNSVINFELEKSNAISFEDDIPDDFTFSGNSQWSRDFGVSYDNQYSMKAGAVSHNQSTVLLLQDYFVSEEGVMSFYKKTSCEEDVNDNFDFLKFEIDGTEQGRWDGITDWTKESFNISTGLHTFKWTFTRDGAAGGGDNTAWVDFIEIPGTSVDTGERISVAKNSSSISPNPFSSTTSIIFNLNADTEGKVIIYNISGKEVANLYSGNLKKGQSRINWNPSSDIEQGIYFVKVITANDTFTNKVILQK